MIKPMILSLISYGNVFFTKKIFTIFNFIRKIFAIFNLESKLKTISYKTLIRNSRAIFAVFLNIFA